MKNITQEKFQRLLQENQKKLNIKQQDNVKKEEEIEQKRLKS